MFRLRLKTRGLSGGLGEALGEPAKGTFLANTSSVFE